MYSKEDIPSKVKNGFKSCIIFSQEFDDGKALTNEKFKSGQGLYDRKGNLIEKILYNTHNEFIKTTYRYDANDNIVEDITYNSQGVIISKTLFDYDEKHNKIKEGYVMGHDTVLVNFDITYTEKGLLAKIICLKSDKSVNYSYTYKYNDTGKKIELLYFYSRKPKNINERTTYKYNSSDSLIETVTYSDGELSTTKVFTYDSMGNLIQIIVSSPDNRHHEEHSFKYDKKGNRIQEVILTSNTMLAAGSKSKNSEYKYDSYGNVIEETSYLGKNPNQLTYRKEYIYAK